ANRGLAVTISANQTVSGRDFGNIADQGTVTGTKFDDLNKDGVRNSGEPGLPGWVIYADLNNDGTRESSEPFTTTDSNGNYSLSIASGTYSVREEPQAGWVQTSPRPGLFSTGNNGTSLITINPATGSGSVVGSFGANIITTFAGAFTPDGTYWTISNAFDASLARLAKVNLSTGAVTTVGSPNWSGAPIVALEADATGNLFAGNFNGVFYSVNQATGELTAIGNLSFSGVKDFTFDNNGTLWAVSANQLYQVNPGSGNAIPGPTITGTNAEVQGIMVDPLSGTFYASTYTGTSRLYTIDLTTGVATPVGPGIGIGALNGGDFMPLSANRGLIVTISAGKTFAGRDFGNLLDQGTVTGTKYNDLNGNGVRDGGEPGLPGWIVYADLDNDNTRDGNEPFATTDSTGAYSLSIPSGVYTLREEPQAGWVQTAPQPGLFASANNGTSLITINPATGSSVVVGTFASQTKYAGAFTPDGKFWTIINQSNFGALQLATVNLSTGAAVPVGTPIVTSPFITALEADASGNLFGCDSNGNFCLMNQTTGQPVLIGNLGFSGITDLTFDNSGELWAVGGTQLYEINPISGTAIPGPAISGVNGQVMGIMVDPLTGIFYATTYGSNSLLYTVDTTTGVATQVGLGLGNNFSNSGDFVPLLANRGISVTVSAGAALSGRDFGNKVANTPPAITSAATASVPENSNEVIQVTASDSDVPTQSITFAIAGGDDADKFTIDVTTGALSFITAPNFEVPTDADGSNVYNVTVKATDSGTPSLLATQAIAVTVTDLNEAPTIVSSSSTSVAENSTAVLTVLASDEDQPAQSITFAIAGGDDADKFTIDATTGALSFITAPNFEVPADADGNNVYNVTVKAIDSGTPSLFTTQAIAVTVTDLNEAPTIVSSSSTSVAENSTAVLTVLASDEDLPAQSITFAIAGGDDADKFTIDATTGALSFITAPNFEVPTDSDGNNVYNVTVKAADSGTPSLFATQAIAVTVTDLNEAPTIVSSFSTSVAENSTAVLTVLASDEDQPAQSIRFAISGGDDAGKFTIDSTTGALSFITAPNFEVPTDANGNNVYNVTVKAIDSGTPSMFTSQAIAVTVTDVNAAIVSLMKLTDGAEGSTPSVGIFRVTQSSVSASDTVVHYTITGSASGGIDYTALSGTVTIPTGQTTADINVTVLDDAIVEGTETVVLTLSSLGVHDPETTLDVTPSRLTAAINILDDDVSTLTISSPTVTEGNVGTSTMTFTVTSPNAVPGGFTVGFNVANLTTQSNDYSVVTTSPLTFSGTAGETRTITLNVIGDINSEANETLSVTLGAVVPGSPAVAGSIISGAVGTGTIVNDDVVTFSVSDAVASESAGVLTFNLVADKAFDTDTTMTVTFTDITATGGGVDYTGTSQQVTFLAGQKTKTVSVALINDTVVEATETFSVALSASTPLNGRLINVTDTGTGTITDNDSATVSIAKVTDGAESNIPVNGSFKVTQTAASSTDTVVNYTIAGTATPGAGKDYQTLSGTVTIPAGQTSAVISVNVLNDDLVESSETVTVTFSSLGAHDPDITLNSSSQNRTATLNITDNDGPTFTSPAAANVPENTSTSTVVLDVNVDTSLAPGFTITYSLSGPDAALFKINVSTGQITFRSSPNFEAPADQDANNKYQLTVTASANTSPVRTSSQDLTITVTPVNDITPVFVNASPTFSLPENSAVGTLVGTVSATDGDQPPQTLTYSITSGNSTGAFTINSLTGQITVANSVPLDFEATNRFTLTVQVSDNGTPAARTANATVVVNLTNVAEPPTITIPTPSTSYTFGSQYAFLAPNSSFAYGDVTNPNFNGAKLTVSIVTGRLANDVLGIVSAGTGSNQINTKNGNKLYLGSTQIGTFTGGSGSSPNLVVTFNSSATVAAVGKLLQQLSLQTNGSVGSTRTVNFQIKGIGGVDSNVAAHDITVVP
ncbi:MAG: hypothetical protein JWM11_7380, partial [Planctomycetaceae bacterium]|nr:hypothetical protein [Planctomycetaceae bacterium]